MKIELIEQVGHKGQWAVWVDGVNSGRAYYEKRYGEHVFVALEKVRLTQGGLATIRVKLNELDWLRGVKHNQKSGVIQHNQVRDRTLDACQHGTSYRYACPECTSDTHGEDEWK